MTIDDVVAVVAEHVRAIDGPSEFVADLCDEVRSELLAMGAGEFESAEADQDILGPRRIGFVHTSTIRVVFRPAGAEEARTYEKFFAFPVDRPRTWRDRPPLL